MPAPIEDPDPQAQLQVQLQVVGKAFDALLLTLYRLTNRHNDLKHHAEDVFKQVNHLPSAIPCLLFCTHLHPEEVFFSLT